MTAQTWALLSFLFFGVLLLVILALVVRGLRGAFRMLLRMGEALGAPPRTRALALAISILWHGSILVGTIPTMLSITMQATVLNAESLRDDVLKKCEETPDACVASAVIMPFRSALTVVTYSVGLAGSPVDRPDEPFVGMRPDDVRPAASPLATLFSILPPLLLTFVVIVVLVGPLERSVVDVNDPYGFGSVYGQNLLFVLTLAIGAYLSVASMVAIPILLDRTVDTTHTPEVLAIELDKIAHNAKKELGLSDEGKTTTTTTLSDTPDTSLPATLPSIPTPADAGDGRSMVERVAAFRLNAGHALISAHASAQQTFEEEDARHAGRGRERTIHYFAVLNWFRQRALSLQTGLTDCKSSESFRRSSPIPVFGQSFGCYVPPERTIPARESLGGSLGPFSFLARWLLATESLALTVIAGMLGFGFLGSASSTFIRELHRRPGGFGPRTLVSDLTGVVLRGASAAIVVFLAVQGGLAVFAARDAEPNPYVLLFTCLVGAVFSEDVWAWAQRELEKRFPRGKPTSDPKSKSEGPDTIGRPDR